MEELLAEYDGTLFLVSHDRAFVDNVVTSCLVFAGDGQIEEYAGGYSDWLRQRPNAPAPKTSSNAEPKRTQKKTPAPRKLAYKDQRELEELPRRIEGLEKERDQIYVSLADPVTATSNPAGLKEINLRFQALEMELAHAYARWEELEAASKAS